MKFPWPFGRRRKPAVSLADLMQVRGRYDSAATNAENANHWANADGLSAKAANSPEVRKRLRERARYERDSNSYCSGMAETIAFDTIGTGPRLRMIGLSPNQGRRISGEFEEWTEAVGLAEKLRTFREARCIDGEGFLLLGNNPGLRTPVKLDLFGVEADQVATPDLWFNDQGAVDGIRFDRYGNPTEYHLLKQHPGDLGQSAVAWGEYDRIPADLVLHWFKARRPGQLRGVPEVTPALPLYAILRRYTLATLSSAEIAAMFGVLLKSTMEVSDDASPITPFTTQEFVRGMIGVLPEGYEAQQVKPEHPATTYDSFEWAVGRQIARCLHIPVSIALGDSSKLNYSSGRLDHQNYHRSIWVDRYSLETRVLDRVFAEWLREAGAVDRRMRVPGTDGARLPRHAWNWDGFKHVDPEKEANAQRQRLANGTSSPQRECAEEGYSFEETLDQIAEARRAYAERGIPYPGDPVPTAPKPAGSAPPGGDGEDDGEDDGEEDAPRDSGAAMNGHRNGATHRG